MNNPAEEWNVSRTIRPPLRWFQKTEGATFAEFVTRNGGAVRFGNRLTIIDHEVPPALSYPISHRGFPTQLPGH
jgi:hypothetical protein